MSPLAEHLVGYLSLFLQIGVVGLLAVLAAMVRFSLGRRGVDGWVAGLVLYAVGLVMIGVVALHAGTENLVAVNPVIVGLYALLEDGAALAFIYALRREREASALVGWMAAGVTLDLILTVVSAMQQTAFFDAYRVHSLFFGGLFIIATFEATRLRDGAGRNVLLGAFTLLALDYVHTPLLALMRISFPETYLGLESYVTVAIDIVLGVGIVVHATDGVRDELESRNAELAAADQALRLAAYGDALTGVANRAAFLERLADPPTRGCVAMIDLDELKRLNDRFGHAAGDAALVSVARVLLQRIGERGTIYRIGGDEFAVIWTGVRVDDARALLSAADADLTVLSEDLRLPQRISWGVAAFDPGMPLNEALITADHTLYTQKAARRR
jgi:diguanylate cyclase (GGDEF)-like protein